MPELREADIFYTFKIAVISTAASEGKDTKYIFMALMPKDSQTLLTAMECL